MYVNVHIPQGQTHRLSHRTTSVWRPDLNKLQEKKFDDIEGSRGAYDLNLIKVKVVNDHSYEVDFILLFQMLGKNSTWSVMSYRKIFMAFFDSRCLDNASVFGRSGRWGEW